MTPDPSTRYAPVARDDHLQDRGLPPERHMRQPAQHRIVPDARPGAARTRRWRCGGAAAQHCVVGFDALGGHGQPETVQTAERIEAGWGSVSHKGPWVFRCGLDTFILPTRGPPLPARPSGAPPSRVAQMPPSAPLPSVKSPYRVPGRFLRVTRDGHEINRSLSRTNFARRRSSGCPRSTRAT